MAAIISVLKQLFSFVFVEQFGSKVDGTLSASNEIPVALLPSNTHSPNVRNGAARDFNVGRYISETEVSVHTEPVQSFDNVIATLQYGTVVDVQDISTSGQWIKIVCDDLQGWIPRDVVVDTPNALIPKLLIGTRYDAYHTETKKLRRIIRDTFNAASLYADLQNVEYVCYRLVQKGRVIDWPRVRPRIAGTWRDILKGNKKIHMSVTPTSASVMEYSNGDGVGHVAFVEAVFPDETIHISEIGYHEEGIYNERTLTREEWREYRPVFIEVKAQNHTFHS